MSSLDPVIAARLKRSADGLVPAVVQQHDTGEVLMLGWMDDEALHRTLSTGRTTFWSRSRASSRNVSRSGHVVPKVRSGVGPMLGSVVGSEVGSVLASGVTGPAQRRP